jgi:hypothetical protein
VPRRHGLRPAAAGKLIAVPPVEEAIRFLREERPAPPGFTRERRRVVGSLVKVREGLEAVAREYAGAVSRRPEPPAEA